jgi:exodeoxyribonuclease VII large subunit
MNSSTQTISPPILTVSQLTAAIKLNIEAAFPSICLQGEISNLKLQTSGHLYFSLKDAHAQVSVVMFRADSATLSTPPKNGDQVMLKGDLTVYASRGNYQLVARELSYIGIGELLQKLEQLKIKLHQKGWFKAARKKPLPQFPKRIGVVTSPTGAVIQDILNILKRRFSGFHLILNPVKVQGEGAAAEIARAIREFNQYDLVDVMIVGRGGGSLEDLWAFNEEIVAEAIFESRIPIISAVGHETDHCIADYVADVRAPTPSAAAEIVVAEKNRQLEYLAVLQKRVGQTVQHQIQKNNYRLAGILKHPLIARPSAFLGPYMQRLDEMRLNLEQTSNYFLQTKKTRLESASKQLQALKPSTQIEQFKQKLSYLRRNLTQSVYGQLERRNDSIRQKTLDLQQAWTSKQRYRLSLFDRERTLKRLDQLIMKQTALFRERLGYLIQTRTSMDPKNLLDKGYSILFSEKDGSVINSIDRLKKGQTAKLWLSDGEASITINEIISREH